MSLTKLWNKAVHGYQYVRQELSRSELELVENSLKEAKQGYQTIYPITGSMHYGAVSGVQRVKLSVEEQQAAIERAEAAKARITAEMKARAEKFSLRP